MPTPLRRKRVNGFQFPTSSMIGVRPLFESGRLSAATWRRTMATWRQTKPTRGMTSTFSTDQHTQTLHVWNICRSGQGWCQGGQWGGIYGSPMECLGYVSPKQVVEKGFEHPSWILVLQLLQPHTWLVLAIFKREKNNKTHIRMF